MRKKEGLILALIGAFLLLINLNVITMDYLLLFIGIIMLILYFTNTNSGVVIPGCILTGIGLYNVLSVYYKFPEGTFLLFLAFAFWGIFFLSKRNSWAIYPAIPLTVLGSLNFIKEYFKIPQVKILGPILLILIGIAIFLKNRD
ncbi:hypothetical protein SAMN02745227_01299 [Anaerobranca californiensis DSM 14826]|jgi:hypothetical protein|uniref:DUF5668 domain-containing protein n=1 Tax=Anaerobranca californiensis DSM 14826 TaxID=1120989 RepID=A0A1M6P016_9FIRM|nr:hypothetical protein [Anaerobranca californiensis]SHK01266.1 hypothetical protein SAMN02745227_01299 [Anaerobranca californiensis DSM 14826]